MIIVDLIKILVSVIKALIFLEKFGIPVEDLIAYLEGLFPSEEETTTAAPIE